MRDTYEAASRVADTYILERGGNRLRIDVEERKWPRAGHFTASAYVMMHTVDGHERWSRLEIERVDEVTSDAAFASAARAIMPRLKFSDPS